MAFWNNLPKFPYGDWQNLNLDWFLDQFHKLCDSFDKLKDFVNTKSTEILNAIGKVEEDVTSAFVDWLNTKGWCWVTGEVDQYITTGVYFEISDAGYLIIHQPASWQQIQFATTGLDIVTELQPEFGHLVISY